MSKLPEEIWNKMKSWLNERVPEPSSNAAPYYTTGDKYDDLEEALKFAYSLAISQPIEGRVMEVEEVYEIFEKAKEKKSYTGFIGFLEDEGYKLISHPAQQEGQGIKTDLRERVKAAWAKRFEGWNSDAEMDNEDFCFYEQGFSDALDESDKQ